MACEPTSLRHLRRADVAYYTIFDVMHRGQRYVKLSPTQLKVLRRSLHQQMRGGGVMAGTNIAEQANIPAAFRRVQIYVTRDKRTGAHGYYTNLHTIANEAPETMFDYVAARQRQMQGSGKGIKRGADDLPTAAERQKARRKDELRERERNLEMMTDGVLEHDAEEQAALMQELQAVRAELRALDVNPDLTDEQLLQSLDAYDAQIPPVAVPMDDGSGDVEQLD